MNSRGTHLRSTACLLVVLYVIESTNSKSIKTNSRPVHEIINEQSRADVDKVRYVNGPGVLEYGNPLAGNSKLVAAQKARIHSQNQQAMFNAERKRQQKAQLLRYQAAPQPDSYMKAYHESHEKHHLDLEKQQASLHTRTAQKHPAKAFSPLKSLPVRPVNTENIQGLNHAKPKQQLNSVIFSNPDVIKITKADAIQNNHDKNRNHRSQGSQYVHKMNTPHQYSNPDRSHSIFVTAIPSYGESGVTIKPHSNIGLNVADEMQPTQEASQLFTEAIPSKTQVIYPKQYTQMQGYKSAHDVSALNSLLTKTPHDQITGLNALLHTSSHINEETHGSPALEHPIDLFFYTKDSPDSSSPSEAPEYEYHPNLYTYGAAYGHQHAPAHTTVAKDHIPIMENYDDVADPNKHKKLKTYGIQSILATEGPKETTTTTNNYYKVEVASQIVSGHPKDKESEVGHYGLQSVTNYVNQGDLPEHYLQQTKGLQSLGHNVGETYPLKASHVYHSNEESGERYLHHNAKGIHPLNGESESSYHDSDNLHYASNYEFGYRVRDHHTGNDFGHHEAKDGDNTKGQYHVLLPDGRLQNVKYWAGPDGFHAHVSYEHA